MTKLKRIAANAGVVVENFTRKLEEARQTRDGKRATFDRLAAQRALFGQSQTGIDVSEDDERDAWADVQDAERAVAAIEAAKAEAERRHADAVDHDREADEKELWESLEDLESQAAPALNEVTALAERLAAASAVYLAHADKLADTCPATEARVASAHRRKTDARNRLAYVFGHHLGFVHDTYKLPALGRGLEAVIDEEHEANRLLGTRVLTPPEPEPLPPKRGFANAILNAIAGGKAA